jgi:hypothetical protein
MLCLELTQLLRKRRAAVLSLPARLWGACVLAASRRHVALMLFSKLCCRAGDNYLTERG